MYGIRPLENSLCQLFFRLLCVFTLYISCKLHVLYTAGREKKQRIGGRKCNDLGRYQGLWRRPAYSLYVCALNCLSFDSSSCHNCVQIRMSRPHYPSHTDEQQLRKKLG